MYLQIRELKEFFFERIGVFLIKLIFKGYTLFYLILEFN